MFLKFSESHDCKLPRIRLVFGSIGFGTVIIPRFSWCQQIVVQRVSSAPTRRKAQTPADARPVLWSTRILHRKRHKEKTKLCGVADPCLPLRKPRRRVARARTSPRDVVREPFISTHHYSCVCQQRSMSQALSSVPVNTASFICDGDRC